MNELHQRLRATHGYIDLGMFQDAWDELESLPPAMRADDAVFETRIAIFIRLENWESARVLAESLAKRSPENPEWWLSWSQAIRQEQTVEAAQAVLRQAADIHPTVAIIAYNLACYACVLGDISEAKELLKVAFRIDGTFKKIALDDPDLDVIFGAGKPENPNLP
jgi:Flp pilus assembly protein TadD